MDTPSFEFGPGDSRQIGDLARKMRSVGAVTVVFGILALVAGVLQLMATGLTAAGAGLVLAAIYLFLTGLWSLRAGREFELVARTEGHDLSHLRTALGNLSRLYGFHHLLTMLLVALMGLAVVFGFLAQTAR